MINNSTLNRIKVIRHFLVFVAAKVSYYSFLNPIGFLDCQVHMSRPAKNVKLMTSKVTLKNIIDTRLFCHFAAHGKISTHFEIVAKTVFFKHFCFILGA